MWDEETLIEPAPIGQDVPAPRRILVIDDDQDHVESLAIALRRQGFDVLTTHNVRAGRAAIDWYQPDLILMDIRLPDGDGLSLCQSLTDDPATCEIPVIVLSGMDRSDIVRRARAAGCQYFLRKPYDPNALLLLAEHVIDV